MKTEKKVSEAILQQGKTIKVGNKEYNLPKPTVATIIMLSELVSTIPCDIHEDEDVLHHVLANAKDMRGIGRILAVLLLGAKQVITEEKKVSYLGILKPKSKVDKLAEELLTELSPREVTDILSTVIESLDIAFFFGTITSLTRVNILTPTKKS